MKGLNATNSHSHVRNAFRVCSTDERRGGMDHRDHPRDPRGGQLEQRPGGTRFGPPGPRDPRGDRGPMPSEGRFQGPGHSPQQQWGPPQGGPPPGGPPAGGPGPAGTVNGFPAKCLSLLACVYGVPVRFRQGLGRRKKLWRGRGRGSFSSSQSYYRTNLARKRMGTPATHANASKCPVLHATVPS